MALNQKILPVGIDRAIDEFQSFIYSGVGFANWECYPRIYMNPTAKGRFPEYYVSNGEYKEVLYDDKFKVTSFFLVSESRPINDDGIVEVEVALIVQADLKKLFPLIPHRADEELNILFHNQSNDYVNNRDFRLISVENGIKKVYAEFDQSLSKFDDMSNQYLARFNYRVRYVPEC